MKKRKGAFVCVFRSHRSGYRGVIMANATGDHIMGWRDPKKAKHDQRFVSQTHAIGYLEFAPDEKGPLTEFQWMD